MGKIISFANEKGGVGKTTLNTLMAHYLAYTKQFNICVVDCDAQKNIENKRIKELKEYEINPKDGTVYEIVSMAPDDFVGFASSLKNHFDYIIVDLPGSLTSPGVLSAFSEIDFIFIPTCLSDFEIDTTTKFYDTLIKGIAPIRKKHHKSPALILGCLNNIIPTHNPAKQFLNNESEIHFPFAFINNYISSSAYLKGDKLTTIGIASSSTKKMQHEDFCDEIIELCDLYEKKVAPVKKSVKGK